MCLYSGGTSLARLWVLSKVLESGRWFRSPLAQLVEMGLKWGQMLIYARVSFPVISNNNVIVCQLGNVHSLFILLHPFLESL